MNNLLKEESMDCAFILNPFTAKEVNVICIFELLANHYDNDVGELINALEKVARHISMYTSFTLVNETEYRDCLFHIYNCIDTLKAMN